MSGTPGIPGKYLLNVYLQHLILFDFQEFMLMSLIVLIGLRESSGKKMSGLQFSILEIGIFSQNDLVCIYL